MNHDHKKIKRNRKRKRVKLKRKAFSHSSDLEIFLKNNKDFEYNSVFLIYQFPSNMIKNRGYIYCYLYYPDRYDVKNLPNRIKIRYRLKIDIVTNKKMISLYFFCRKITLILHSIGFNEDKV